MVKDNMCFSSFTEFYVKRNVIRLQYIKMSTDDKVTYKYYVYSRRTLKEKVCDMIWEYINVVDGEELVRCSEALNKEYTRYM